MLKRHARVTWLFLILLACSDATGGENANISGQWLVTMPVFDGDLVEYSFTFVQSGAGLVGQLEAGCSRNTFAPNVCTPVLAGTPHSVTGGSVRGDSVFFSVFSSVYRGVITSAGMNGKATHAAYGAVDWTATRR